ncbi:MAG: hypothetical protein PVJ21_16965 [Anaerolineales bacterium]|jgi:hypothetical protein
MSKKSSKKSKRKRRTSLGQNIILMLTLVPVVIGLLLIVAWALELEIFANQSEVQVGIFFLLLGFFLSNILQKKYGLAAGWGALAAADLIVLSWWNIWAQVIASIAGLSGIIFLGVEFYKQYQRDKLEKADKKM